MEETQWLICQIWGGDIATLGVQVTEHAGNIPRDTQVLHSNGQEVLLKLQVLRLLVGQRSPRIHRLMIL